MPASPPRAARLRDRRVLAVALGAWVVVVVTTSAGPFPAPGPRVISWTVTFLMVWVWLAVARTPTVPRGWSLTLGVSSLLLAANLVAGGIPPISQLRWTLSRHSFDHTAQQVMAHPVLINAHDDGATPEAAVKAPARIGLYPIRWAVSVTDGVMFTVDETTPSELFAATGLHGWDHGFVYLPRGLPTDTSELTGAVGEGGPGRFTPLGGAWYAWEIEVWD